MIQHGVVGRSIRRLAVLAPLVAMLLAGFSPLLAPGARAADSHRSRLALLVRAGDVEAAADSLKVLVPGEGSGEGQADTRAERWNAKLIGTTFFASGLFLCSWGIASWQVDEYQCCPPRNTENVIKIVVGVVLLNAGLFYLLGGAD
jgi:hypothetical protein